MSKLWNKLFPKENGTRVGEVLLNCWTANGEGISVNGIYKESNIPKDNIRKHLNTLLDLGMIKQIYKKHTLTYFITDKGVEIAKALNSIKNYSS